MSHAWRTPRMETWRCLGPQKLDSGWNASGIQFFHQIRIQCCKGLAHTDFVPAAVRTICTLCACARVDLCLPRGMQCISRAIHAHLRGLLISVIMSPCILRNALHHYRDVRQETSHERRAVGGPSWACRCSFEIMSKPLRQNEKKLSMEV